MNDKGIPGMASGLTLEYDCYDDITKVLMNLTYLNSCHHSECSTTITMILPHPFLLSLPPLYHPFWLSLSSSSHPCSCYQCQVHFNLWTICVSS